METNANNLVDIDPETNAIIPVVQAYANGLTNTEVVGNFLHVRGEKNALIPVVKVVGSGDSDNNSVTLSVDEYEALEVKDPNTIYYVY